MKPLFSRPCLRVWVGLLLVTLFTLPALSPLWGLTLPQGYDGLHRLHRLIEFDQAVRHGVLFPRWAPDVVYGYGYPIFNYFPYVHYYLPELLHLLGLPFSQALVAAFLLYTLLAGYSMYLLCRDFLGEAPALLAAVAYVYAPYQLHNSLVRGNLPEQFGLALFPLLLWAFRRLVHQGGRRWFVTSATLYAVFLLSHNVLSLMFTPLLVLYAVGAGLARARAAFGWQRWLPVAALGLGGSLAAFFLLPALFEKEWVRIGQNLGQIASFGGYFLSLEQLFSPPPPALVRLLHRPDYEALGWVQLAVGLPGALLAWRLPHREARTWAVLLALILVGSAYATLPWSAWLWERLPLMPYLLYPSRFLGLTSLALALLAAATVAALPPGSRWRLVALAAGATGILLLALPLLYPHYYPPHLLSQNVTDVLAFERRTGLLGTSSYAEYLPLWVKETPTDSPLLPAYQAGQPPEAIERFDVTSLPVGGRVIEARYGFNRVEITVSSRQAFQARFHTFYFPGWKATVNGERANPAPAGSQGLLGLTLPAGESRVRLWFGDTPWRTAGKAISLVSAGLLLALALRRDSWTSRPLVPGPKDQGLAALPPASRVLSPLSTLSLGQSTRGLGQRTKGPLSTLSLGQSTRGLGQRTKGPLSTLSLGQSTRGLGQRTKGPPKGWDVRQAVLLGALALGLLAAKLVYVDRHDSPFRRQGFNGVRVEEADHALNVSFGDQLTLLGYGLSADGLHPGDEADLTLYWSQQRRLTRRPRVVPVLINPANGDALPQAAGWVPQDYPLEFWKLGWYARDVHRLVIPADAPPGRYLLTLKLFDEAGGDDIGETVTLTTVKVPLPRQDVWPEYPLDVTLGGEIALTGYDLAAGDPLHLTLYWRCLTAPGDDYTVFVHLLDANNAIVAQADSQPRGGTYPTSIWTPGEVVPDEFVLPMTGLPPGDYHLAVGLYRLASSERLLMTDANGQLLPDDRSILPLRWP